MAAGHLIHQPCIQCPAATKTRNTSTKDNAKTLRDLLGGPQYLNPAAAARGRGAEGGAAVLGPGPPPPVAVGPRGGPQSPPLLLPKPVK